MFIAASSMLDKAWLHCALPMQLVILPIFFLFSACLPVFSAVSTRIRVILFMGYPNKGVRLIFRCLCFWQTFLIMWNAIQGPFLYCIALWSNRSIVWATLLPSNEWHSCVNFYSLFLKVSYRISYSIKAENGAVSYRETHTYTFLLSYMSPLFFFCNTFAVLWSPTFSLSFLSFSFNLSLIILH